MKVEVAFATPKLQKILVVDVREGTSAHDAVVASNIGVIFPEIDLDNIPMGIFSKAIRNPKEQILREGDRVELYRPLTADPKVTRARRAAKLKADVEKTQ